VGGFDGCAVGFVGLIREDGAMGVVDGLGGFIFVGVGVRERLGCGLLLGTLGFVGGTGDEGRGFFVGRGGSDGSSRLGAGGSSRHCAGLEKPHWPEVELQEPSKQRAPFGHEAKEDWQPLSGLQIAGPPLHPR